MAKFPKTLFVKTEKDGGTEYFVADANAAGLVEMGDKIAIATYQLLEVRAAEGVASFGNARKAR
jgi:hypothetical protein